VVLPESPKYLHSVNDYSGAKKSLQRIAVMNNQTDEDFSQVKLEGAVSNSQISEDEGRTAIFGFIDLWRDKTTLRNTISMAYLWGFYTFGHH